jgi:hypothetical protein
MNAFLPAIAVGLALLASSATAQVKVDLDYERYKAAFKTDTVRDLAVNDTAYVSPGAFCYDEGRLYMPSSTQLQKRSPETYSSLRVKMGTGKRIEATVERPANPAPDFDWAKDFFENFFVRSLFWGFDPCKAQNQSPLVKAEFYPVVSIDGFDSLSAMFEAEMAKRQEKATPKKAAEK